MKNAWSGIIYLPLNYLIFDCNATHATSLSNQWNLTLLIECVYLKTYKIPVQIHLNIVNLQIYLHLEFSVETNHKPQGFVRNLSLRVQILTLP